LAEATAPGWRERLTLSDAEVSADVEGVSANACPTVSEAREVDTSAPIVRAETLRDRDRRSPPDLRSRLGDKNDNFTALLTSG
jgi:hypothetical protein